MGRNKQRKEMHWGPLWSARSREPARRNARTRRLSCEPLEDRRLLSGITLLSGHIFRAASLTDNTYTSQAGVVGAAVDSSISKPPA